MSVVTPNTFLLFPIKRHLQFKVNKRFFLLLVIYFKIVIVTHKFTKKFINQFLVCCHNSANYLEMIHEMFLVRSLSKINSFNAIFRLTILTKFNKSVSRTTQRNFLAMNFLGCKCIFSMYQRRPHMVHSLSKLLLYKVCSWLNSCFKISVFRAFNKFSTNFQFQIGCAQFLKDTANLHLIFHFKTLLNLFID